MYVSLGEGLPSQLNSYISKDILFEQHSENGILGVGKFPKSGS